MSRYCDLTGVGPLTGNNRSHSLRATRRRWNVNLHKVRMTINGKKVTLNVSARGLRSLRKQISNMEAQEHTCQCEHCQHEEQKEQVSEAVAA